MADAWRLLVLASLALGILAPGCVRGPSADDAPAEALANDAGGADARATYAITCRLLKTDDAPLAGGSCVFAYGDVVQNVTVDASGNATLAVPARSTLALTGRADGYVEGSGRFVVAKDDVVTFRLRPIPALPGDRPANGSLPRPPHEVRARPWMAGVRVAEFDTEPWVEIDRNGVIYDAPTTTLHASYDRGATWRELQTGALPTLASDASLDVAPDGTVWYSRLWGYAGGTLVCKSGDVGAHWTCNDVAAPGVTDRMSVLGLSSTTAILQTNQGTEKAVWLKTTDGGTTFVPTTVSDGSVIDTRLGNMAFDDVHRRAWQVGNGPNDRLVLVHLDNGVPTPAVCPTPVPSGMALPTVAQAGGALWLAEESGASVIVARTRDSCITWKTWTLPSQAKRLAMAAVGASGDRVGVAYYGSTDAADAGSNAGSWSVYVTETDDASSDEPAWVETVAAPNVHAGPLCISIACDPAATTGARFAGDFMSVAVDADGNVVVGYNDDKGDPDHDWTKVVRQAG